MKISTLLTFASASIALATSKSLETRETNWTVGQTVQTSSGPVSGHPAKNDSGVSEYLGIQYGQAARWEAPARFNGTQPINGSVFGPSCPVKPGTTNITQAEIEAANVTSVGFAVLASLSNTGAVYSEDCLYLNVWTKPQVGEEKKAVLIWIYGGGFSSGSSSIPGYNGANIVEQEDVIVVSLNYRLSVLGFPGNPIGTNNLGLLDQRLAVEWVRDNIANFGGDPSRITLFGQSAGSASIDFYSYAWTKDPIAAGFIPESGTAFSWGFPNSKEMAADGWFSVSANLGCGDASSDPNDVLACMRKQNYTAVLEAIPTLTGTASILGLFGPTVDDTVVLSNYTAATPAKVPMLIGSNNYEAGLFRTQLALKGVFFPNFFWDVFNLQEFTCPAGIRANVSWAAGTPIWRYRYFGVFPDLAVSTEAGTWHAAEIPILFDTTPTDPGPTTEEISIADYMRGAWAAFAKDPQKGLLTYGEGWPTYDPSKDTLIRLAFNNVTGANIASPYIYDAFCPFVNVSSTNASAFVNFPSFNPTSAPTALPTASSTGSGGVSTTGSATGTAATATETTKGNVGSRFEMSIWVVLAAGIAAWLI